MGEWKKSDEIKRVKGMWEEKEKSDGKNKNEKDVEEKSDGKEEKIKGDVEKGGKVMLRKGKN